MSAPGIGLLWAQPILNGPTANADIDVDAAAVMKVMADGKYDIASVITHEFPHGEQVQALELAGRPDKALNVVIRFEN